MIAVLPGPNTWVLDDRASDAAYCPINLRREFQEEGLRVYVEGYRIRDYKVLLHDPVEIRTITRLTDGGRLMSAAHGGVRCRGLTHQR